MRRNGADRSESIVPVGHGQISAADRYSFDATPVFDPATLRVESSGLFFQAAERTRMAICISDPHQDDCPLVYVNRAFTEVTGYTYADAVGRNCRFLQGRETDPAAVEKLREAIAASEDAIVEVLNYRKDGAPFWNAVQIAPIYDAEGKLAYLYGSQWDISRLVAEREQNLEQHRIATELRHRTGNIFAVVSALIRLSSRNAGSAAELADKLAARIGALAIAHRVSIDAESRSDAESDLRTLVEEVIDPYRSEEGDRFDIVGPAVELSRKLVTPIGLAVHELATNALKYGALGKEGGKVRIDWSIHDGHLVLHWTETGGPTVAAQEDSIPKAGHGNGSRIMRGVLAGVGGSIALDFNADGVRAELSLPL